MATVTFSAAGETLYAYLAGEIDHDAAQRLRLTSASSSCIRRLWAASWSILAG